MVWCRWAEVRVIGGEFRSRKLLSLPGDEVRPTPDRMRETLFNVLQGDIGGAVFADVYAGTGAVGIEALSRGAAEAIFIEKDKQALGVIKANLAALKIGRTGRVIAGYAAGWVGQIEADIIFADPPYPKEREYRAVLEAVEQKPPKLLILQHSVRFEPPAASGKLSAVRVVKQGENALTFYRPNESSGPASDDSHKM